MRAEAEGVALHAGAQAAREVDLERRVEVDLQVVPLQTQAAPGLAFWSESGAEGVVSFKEATINMPKALKATWKVHEQSAATRILIF